MYYTFSLHMASSDEKPAKVLSTCSEFEAVNCMILSW